MPQNATACKQKELPRRAVLRKNSAYVANVDQSNGIGAGVGGNNAAQREGDERVFAERLAAGLDQIILLGDVGVADHIIKVFRTIFR